MFSFAVTRKSLKDMLNGYTMHENRVNSHVITLITDDLLSRFYVDNRLISLIEAPFDGCIFSEVLFDKLTARLTISRSINSGRHIYYHINKRGDLFCSSHINLLRVLGVHIEEQPCALTEILVFRSIMPPCTLYKDIFQLKPGDKISFEPNVGKYELVERKEFSPPTPGEIHGPVSQSAQRVRMILSEAFDALDKRKISTLLSGGLDSSILYTISRNLHGISQTFSTGYPVEIEKLEMEKDYALSAAEALNSQHTHYSASHKDYLRGLILATLCAEEPIRHMQSAMMYLLFKEVIPNDRNIIINGNGADSLWGDSSHNQIFLSGKFPTRIASIVLNKFNLLNPMIKLAKIIRKGRNIMSAIDAVQRMAIPLSDPDNIIWIETMFGDIKWVSSNFKRSIEDILRSRLELVYTYKDRSVYDILTLLIILDGISTTNAIWSNFAESQGKILYFPYTSKELIDLAFSISWDIKARRPKNILVETARQLGIPNFIIERPKTGFGIKRQDWALKGGPFEPLIPLAVKVMDIDDIRKTQSRDNKMGQIFWNMLNYSIWKRLCILKEPVSILLGELDESCHEQGI